MVKKEEVIIVDKKRQRSTFLSFMQQERAEKFFKPFPDKLHMPSRVTANESQVMSLREDEER